MDAKQAISLAKAYIAEIFGEEGAFNIGLEEVKFDDEQGTWDVTIGFSRSWDQPAFRNALAPQTASRTYKVVEIDDVHEVVRSVTNRPQTNPPG